MIVTVNIRVRQLFEGMVVRTIVLSYENSSLVIPIVRCNLHNLNQNPNQKHMLINDNVLTLTAEYKPIPPDDFTKFIMDAKDNTWTRILVVSDGFVAKCFIQACDFSIVTGRYCVDKIDLLGEFVDPDELSDPKSLVSI